MGPRQFSRLTILLPTLVRQMELHESGADHSPNLAHCRMFGCAGCCRFHLYYPILVSSHLQTKLISGPRYSHCET